MDISTCHSKVETCYHDAVAQLTGANLVRRRSNLHINQGKYVPEGIYSVPNGIVCPYCYSILRNQAILNNHLEKHVKGVRVQKIDGIFKLVHNSP